MNLKLIMKCNRQSLVHTYARSQANINNENPEQTNKHKNIKKKKKIKIRKQKSQTIKKIQALLENRLNTNNDKLKEDNLKYMYIRTYVQTHHVKFI